MPIEAIASERASFPPSTWRLLAVYYSSLATKMDNGAILTTHHFIAYYVAIV